MFCGSLLGADRIRFDGKEMDVDKFPEGLQVLAVDDNRAGLLLLRRQLKFCNYNKG